MQPAQKGTDLGFATPGSFGCSGLGFRVSGLGFRVYGVEGLPRVPRYVSKRSFPKVSRHLAGMSRVWGLGFRV